MLCGARQLWSDFSDRDLKYDGRLAVKCSNYIGETIDDAMSRSLGMKGILLIGHWGNWSNWPES